VEVEFERFVIGTGLPMVRGAGGCTHVTAGKSCSGDRPEFVVVTHWRSVDHLQAFAGPDWQRAVIEPEEEHMLSRVFCDHYETLAAGRSWKAPAVPVAGPLRAKRASSGSDRCRPCEAAVPRSRPLDPGSVRRRLGLQRLATVREAPTRELSRAR
jgi:hypothetical protein